MTTINRIARKIIKEIKAFPEEARQFQGESGPKTSWDEYMEQIQYEEYDSFEIFQDTIESMVDDEIQDLSEDEMEVLYKTIYKSYYPSGYDEMREDIKEAVLSCIQEEAESGEIEYRKPVIEFIRYYEDDLIIIAEVIKQIGPAEYLIHSYSEATGNAGVDEISDLTILDEENGLERITSEEFERVKNILKTKIESEKAEGIPQIVEDFENGSQSHKTTNNECQPDHLTKRECDLKDLKTQDEQRRRSQENSQVRPGLDDNEGENGKEVSDQGPERDEGRTGTEETKREQHGLNRIDPEAMQAGITLAGYHIEAGARKFTDFAKVMVKDIGVVIKPYLKMFYTATRYYPGFNSEGMDGDDIVSQTDLDEIKEE